MHTPAPHQLENNPIEMQGCAAHGTHPSFEDGHLHARDGATAPAQVRRGARAALGLWRIGDREEPCICVCFSRLAHVDASDCSQFPIQPPDRRRLGALRHGWGDRRPHLGSKTGALLGCSTGDAGRTPRPRCEVRAHRVVPRMAQCDVKACIKPHHTSLGRRTEVGPRPGRRCCSSSGQARLQGNVLAPRQRSPAATKDARRRVARVALLGHAPLSSASRPPTRPRPPPPPTPP
jgi:hypothetical protein